MLSCRDATGASREGGGRGSPESEDLPPAPTPVPLAEGGNVLQRSFSGVLAVVLALVLVACGGDDGAANGAAAEPQAAVLVTERCGKDVVVERTKVPAGQTAMQALDRVADVETDQGGKFVTAIEGVEQDADEKLAWLFYVNGKMAEKGAAQIRLKDGDVEWWDLHDWESTCPVPAEAQ
jgi:Domain of unknown function (DUF4430)